MVCFSKHSAGIAGRKPYGITTRMLEIVGWKRIEMNRLMRFAGVTEINFQSILRRSFVWKPRARFVDEEYLLNHYPNHAADGVYPKKPLLKKFLSSGPAAAAGLRLQHGFEALHSPADCRHRIEAYAALGGDDGMTEDCMRLACGLSARNRRNDIAGGAAAIAPASAPELSSELSGLMCHCYGTLRNPIV